MQVNKTTEFIVGLVSIVAVLIFIVGIILLKGGAVSNSTLIKVRLDNSGGIKPSSPLIVNGVRRGLVRQIIAENNSVIVTAEIDRIDDLTKDVSAKVTILEITGGKKLELINGISNQKFNPNNEIKGYASKDISDLVALVGDASGDLIEIIKKINDIAGSVDNILKDTIMVRDVKETFANTNELTANANALLRDNKGILNRTLADLNILTKDLKLAIENNEPKLGKLLDSIDVTVTRANKLITNIDGLSSNAVSLINNTNSIITDIKTNESILNRIMYDKQFALTIDSAMTSISKLMDFIQVNGVNVNVRLGTRP